MKILNKNQIMLTALVLLHSNVYAADQVKLANQLNNPIAALISVPIDYLTDEEKGATGEGKTTVVKASPVAPFELNEDWLLISRTIIPFIEHENFPVAGQNDSGLGDIAASFFFSPKLATESGWIWGVGVVALLDTASEDTLGGGKWGLGPTFVTLKQDNDWTVGFLTHYIVDVAGDNNRADLEQAFLQPFVSYVIKSTRTSFTLQSEFTRDLEANESAGFAKFEVGQMFKIGSQIMQLRVGFRNWYESPTFGPEGTTFTARLTFLFPT